LVGSLNIIWENDIKEDSIMKINNWTKCIQDRIKRKEVCQEAKRTNSEVVAPDEDEEWLI
jgi:hypothetical protein